MKENSNFFLLLFCVILSTYRINAQLGASNCNSKTNAELKAMGYESVKAYGAMGDGVTDDTDAIQATIDAAYISRKSVYFQPGTYLISNTLIVEQTPLISGSEITNDNNGFSRFGYMLIGSYCGNEKPIIKLKDNLTEAATLNTNNPFPVFKLYRDSGNGDGTTDDSRAWNMSVRNLTIDLGVNNPGAVGIDQASAEGCSIQEVTIQARDSFAGFYNLNNSGGYTYNVEVIGGKHGIYFSRTRGGACLVIGLKLSGQLSAPIAVRTYIPFGVVGFDISSGSGQIISNVNGSEITDFPDFHDTGTHIYLIDGKIEVIGNSDNDAIIKNKDRSVYLKNVYVKGRSKVHSFITHIDDPTVNGELKVLNPSIWSKVNEFSFTSGLFDEKGNLLQGVNTNNTFFANDTYDSALDINNYLFAPDTDMTVTKQENPGDLIAKHTFDIGLENPEATNLISVLDYGANPNDDIDDTQNIQDAIDAAGDNGTVFLPAGEVINLNNIERLGHYKISNTLILKKNTNLFGVSRYNSVLDAQDWENPAQNSPVILSENAKDAAPAISDFKIILPPTAKTGTYNGIIPEYEKHIYAIHWKSGANSIYKDVFSQSRFGEFGDRKVHIISDNGGGRWYGITQSGAFPPCVGNPGSCIDETTANFSYLDNQGRYISHPESKKMLIEGTTQELNFYPFHCQHDIPVEGSLWEINNASNVNAYGIKSEMGTIPERMVGVVENNPASIVPVWLKIIDSNNISLFGHEATSQTGVGRGLIEITGNSYNISVATMGRRGIGLKPLDTAINQDEWYFVKEIDNGSINSVTAQGFLSLFKSKNTNNILSIDEVVVNNKIFLYPNPVENSLNIESTDIIEKISIYNLLGQEIYTKTINGLNANINVNFISAGMYLVNVKAINTHKTFKIIKKN